MTPAYVWAIENETRLSPEYIEKLAQNKADFLESVLLADGETTPGQRTACTIAVTFFETCGVLNDSDVYGPDRAGLVKKCKQFAYGIDRHAEQHLMKFSLFATIDGWAIVRFETKAANLNAAKKKFRKKYGKFKLTTILVERVSSEA